MSNETWMNAKKAVELGFADEILFAKKEEEPDSDPADPENPEKDPDSEPGEGEEKKPFQKDTAGHLFSSRQMDLIVLNRLGVKPEQTEPKAKEPEKTPPAEPPANPGPVLDMDGKTEDGSIPYNSNLDLFSLEMFEDLAWLMARHADPANVPDSPEEFLDQFNTFSIYQILPQLIELWGLNVQTEVESRKNLAKVSGK